MSFKLRIDSDWTLFLDRDGVINQRIFGSYVLDKSQFIFLPGVLDSFAQLSTYFKRIIVVTNQQCIAKGLLSEQGLEEIHHQMKVEIESVQGRIDAVFVAKELKNTAPFYRKPNGAMAILAKERFPEIDFEKSVMVGDTDSDLQFGKGLGMKTVLMQSAESISEKPDYSITHFNQLCDLLYF